MNHALCLVEEGELHYSSPLNKGPPSLHQTLSVIVFFSLMKQLKEMHNQIHHPVNC